MLDLVRGHGVSAQVCGRALIRLVLLLLTACSGSDGPAGPGAPPPVGAVQVSPAVRTLDIGATVQLGAVVRSAGGDTLKNVVVTWRSDDTLVAKVSSTGTVTARGVGTTRISASAGGRAGHATITVQAVNPIPSITALTPSSIAAGGPDLALTVTGTGFRANVRVQWNGQARPTERISETEVRATIYGADVAEVGVARVQVVNTPPGGGPSAEVQFAIVPQTTPVASVELSKSVAMTIVGQPVPLTARLLDGAGNELTGRQVTWSSSNQLVATVNGSGLVHAVGVGEAVISAASEGRTATLALSVATEAMHLILDDATGLSSLDMRLGGSPVRFWEHGTSTRASDPSVSPDRRWIAYTIQLSAEMRDIARLDQVTRTYQFLTTDGVSDQPAWSPAGDLIAFRSHRSGRADVWVMRADGTGALNLTADMQAGAESGNPAWSPDGTRIVFSSGGEQAIRGLFVMKADGTARQHVTFSPGTDTEPSWHGDAVVFTRHHANGGSDLFRSSIGGGQIIQLTHSGNASMPAWSPDGRWIAFVSRTTSTGPGDLMAVRPFGEEIRPLSVRAAQGGGGLNPTWVSH